MHKGIKVGDTIWTLRPTNTGRPFPVQVEQITQFDDGGVSLHVSYTTGFNDKRHGHDIRLKYCHKTPELGCDAGIKRANALIEKYENMKANYSESHE